MVYFYEVLSDENNHPMLNIKNEIDVDETNMSIEESVEMLNHFFNMDCLNVEHAYLVGFNRNMDAVGIFLISIGSYKKCYFYERSIITFLLLSGAERFILYHNHPNGDLNISQDDKISLIQIKSLSAIFEVEFIDSIIITKNGWRCINGGQCYEYDEEDGI